MSDIILSSERLRPGEARIIEELGKAAEAGLGYNEISVKANLHQSIVAEYLKHLCKMKLVEKIPGYGRQNYRLLIKGKEVLDTREDITIISRAKKVFRKTLQPSDMDRVLPVYASMYLSPEIERLTQLTADELENSRGPPISKDEARTTLLEEITQSLTGHFDNLFVNKFYEVARRRLVYRVQQMQPVERRDFLRRLHYMALPSGRDAVARTQMKKGLDDIERTYMAESLPEGGPDLKFESLLDFELAIMTSVSSESLKRDSERIRNRLTTLLLSFKLSRLYQVPHFIWPAMMEAGMITPDEYQEYLKAKGSKRTEQILRKLRKKYYALAYVDRSESTGPVLRSKHWVNKRL